MTYHESGPVVAAPGKKRKPDGFVEAANGRTLMHRATLRTWLAAGQFLTSFQRSNPRFQSRRGLLLRSNSRFQSRRGLLLRGDSLLQRKDVARNL